MIAQTSRAPQADRYALLYQSLSLDTRSPTHERRLADLWRDMGDLRASLPAYTAALTAAPEAALALQLAEFYLTLEDYSAALHVLELGHAAAPRSASLNAMLGFLLAPSLPERALPHLRSVGFDDRYDSATLPLIALIRQEAGFVSPVYSAQVGAVLASAGRLTLAEHAYRFAVAQEPTFAEALAQIAYLRSQQGRDSAYWLEQALALAPTSSDVRLAQALILRQQGELDAALEALAIARLYAPADPVLYRETARTYEQLGRDDLAAVWQAQADALTTAP
ncbi:hypothetical protein VZO05_02125 [Aggregatilineales bacterium SYSU G02658]